MTESHDPARTSFRLGAPLVLYAAPYLGAGRGGPAGPGADWAG